MYKDYCVMFHDVVLLSFDTQAEADAAIAAFALCPEYKADVEGEDIFVCHKDQL